VILLVTGRAAAPGFAGLAIGLALTAVHLVGIPLTGTSVNPARSLGPAVFAGGDPLTHVWLFLLAPLVGAALAVLAVRGIAVPLQAEPAAGVDETGVQVPAAGADRESQVPPARRPPATEERGGRRSRT
jgi:aquaporin Z